MKEIFKNKKVFLTLIVSTILMLPMLKVYANIPFPHLHNVFIRVGNMHLARSGHQSVLLNDGRVLIYGGDTKNEIEINNTLEIYNPKSKSFKLIGQTLWGNGDTATVLKNGLVLITGINKSAELINPTTGKCIPTESMNYPRMKATATLLQDGRVLIAGGGIFNRTEGKFEIADFTEIYNPETQKFEIGPKLNTPRFKHGAALLNNGNVLIIGGSDGKDRLKSAEIYDVKNNKFIKINNMKYVRDYPQVIKLKNGKILIIGGYGKDLGNALRPTDEMQWIRIIEIYDQESKEFILFTKNDVISPTSKATLLKNGNVLFTAGAKQEHWYAVATKDSSILDINKRQFKKGPNLNIKRARHSAVLLNDGTVLVTGGRHPENMQAEKSAELYIP